jgi:hypothetical protein
LKTIRSKPISIRRLGGAIQQLLLVDDYYLGGALCALKVGSDEHKV